MGLKKNNHEVKSIGIILPTAYAQVREIQLHGTECSAVIYIHKDRESVATFAPIDQRTIYFTFDRGKNLLEQIYAKAKDSYFGNWEDDIVTETEATTEESTEVAEE